LQPRPIETSDPSHSLQAVGCRPKTKNPLIACLGRARVGSQRVYRFSLLTLLFSGVLPHFTLPKALLVQVLQNFTFFAVSSREPRNRQWFARMTIFINPIGVGEPVARPR